MSAAAPSATRVAMLTPLPPETSGVADHTAHLLSPLAERFELEVFTRDPERSAAALRCGLPLHRFREHRPSHDRVALYQLGNHAGHHAEIYDHARAHPGIVVLHEYVLHDLVRDCALAAGGRPAYHEELRYAVGRSGERLAATLEAGGERPSPFAWPLFERAVDSSLAVVVHSRAARDRIVKSRPLAQVRVVPLALPPTTDWSDSAATLRQELEIAPGAAVIGAFGVAAAAKRLDVVLRAFARLARRHDDCVLLVAGPESPRFLRETAGLAPDLEPRVRVLDRVSIDRLQAAMAATDVALNLRHPTGGETSSTCLRLLGLGRAVVVSATGWFDEIPGDCCARVAIDALEEPELDVVLEALLAQPHLRRAMGENGARWARATHSIEAAVDAYAAVIDEVAAEGKRTPRATALPAQRLSLQPPLLPYSRDDVATELMVEVAKALGDLGVTEADDEVLTAVAGRLAELDLDPMSRRICIDARKLADFGIGTYIRNLLKSLAEIDSANHYWILVGRDARGFVDRLGPNFHAFTETSTVYSLRELGTVSWALRRLRPDVYHATHYVLPAHVPCPSVVTIHDIIHLLFPQFLKNRLALLYARLMIGRSLRLGRRIITVSEATRDDVQDFFGVDGRSVRVVYNGVDDVFRRPLAEEEIQAKLQRFRLKRPYLLFVGNPKPHKNVENLLRAYARALQLAPGDTALACVGDRDGESARLRYLCQSIGVAERVAFLGHVPDDDLPALYQGALAFLYPSLYEGFGLPVIEAMASKVPVITSTTAALREVAGGAADLVNPHDVEDIAKAIAKCIVSPEHRAELAAKGVARSADFDWRATAERTLEVYREAMGDR